MKLVTQNELILAHLKRGHTLTSLEALRRFEVLRLPSRIAELRQAGHPIRTEMIKTTTGKHVARYDLPSRR